MPNMWQIRSATTPLPLRSFTSQVVVRLVDTVQLCVCVVVAERDMSVSVMSIQDSVLFPLSLVAGASTFLCLSSQDTSSLMGLAAVQLDFVKLVGRDESALPCCPALDPAGLVTR